MVYGKKAGEGRTPRVKDRREWLVSSVEITGENISRA